MFRPQPEILLTIMLISMISLSYCMQITTESNIASPNSGKDNINNYDNSNKKALKNDTKNEEISSFKYFKNFISKLITSEYFFDKLSFWQYTSSDFPDNYIRTRLNSNKSKTLNFNDNSVKVAEVPNCNLENCERGNGRCVSENKCQCNYSFINLPRVSKKACDYKLSYQLTGILLEMLIPIGFGHFYCKRYLIGFIKFSVLFLIPLIIYAIFKAYLFDDEVNTKIKTHGNNRFKNFFSFDNIIKRLFSFYYLIIFFVWYLFDLVIFAANKHKDGSGFDLIPIYNN